MRKLNLFRRKRKVTPVVSAIQSPTEQRDRWKKAIDISTIFTSVVAAASAIFSVYQFKKSVDLSNQTLAQATSQIKLANDQFLYQRHKDSLDQIEQNADRLSNLEERQRSRVRDSVSDQFSRTRFQKDLEFQQNLINEQTRGTKAFEESSLPSVSSKLELAVIDTLAKKYLVCNILIDNSSLKAVRVLRAVLVFLNTDYQAVGISLVPSSYMPVSMLHPLESSSIVGRIIPDKQVSPLYASLMITYQIESSNEEKNIVFHYTSTYFNSAMRKVPIVPVPSEQERKKLDDILLTVDYSKVKEPLLRIL